ncbi:flavin monoamine oxidase family protein [Streptosporangium sp. NPDC001559]|uniref:flavin monoamine oxidase family protein n=1 Tax=Streptosporangium sp. NPDC001559 TaxID=3366187 RepID=UPI0036E66FFE
MYRDQLTRRAFVNLVGRAGGAGAAYGTLTAMGLLAVPEAYAGRPDLARHGGGRGVKVAVIGAGISGMVAALELSAAQYDVRVFEAQDRVGGRIRTYRGGDTVVENGSVQRVDWDRDPGLYFNAGPARIPHHHEALLGYCRDLDIPLQVFVNDNRAAYLHDAAAFGGRPQRARRVITDTRGAIAELAARALKQDLDRPMSEEDLARVRDFIQGFGGLDGNYRYTGSPDAGYSEPPGGPEPGQVLEPLDLVEISKGSSLRWRALFSEQYPQQSTVVEPTGGMDAIARAFYRRTRRFVTLNAQVTKLRRSGSGAQVTWRDRVTRRVQVWDADHVIVTVPLTVVNAIDSDFSPPVKRAVEAAVPYYIPAVKIAFQADRWWEKDHQIYGGISWSSRDITQMWYPSSNLHARKGILVGAYIWTHDIGNSFSAMTPAQRAAAAVADGEHLYPGYRNLVGRPVSVAWPNVPFQGGAWIDWGDDPATRRDIYSVLLPPDGPYWFAGEHMSHINGWQEGSIRATHNVLHGIQARVTHE